MSKPLVTYFGATGTTEKTAKKLAAAIGADLSLGALYFRRPGLAERPLP